MFESNSIEGASARRGKTDAKCESKISEWFRNDLGKIYDLDRLYTTLTDGGNASSPEKRKTLFPAPLSPLLLSQLLVTLPAGQGAHVLGKGEAFFACAAAPSVQLINIRFRYQARHFLLKNPRLMGMRVPFR